MRKSADTFDYEQIPTWNKELNIGDKLEGKYLRKEVFIGDYGETTKYVIETTDGTKYGVYGSASLNRQFTKVPEGAYVWLEYKGETTSQKGRKVKLFSVDFDDEYQA